MLISTVGTIGNVAVVQEDLLPANADRHVGIIRPNQHGTRPLSPAYLAAFLLSRHGRMQSQRETTGNVQPNLFLIKIRDFMVARHSATFESRIQDVWIHAHACFRCSTERQLEADEVVLATLGLAAREPREPLTYTVRARDALEAGRIDPQYFMPAKGKVRRALASMPSRVLSNHVSSIRDMFVPDRAPPSFRVRNYDVTDALVPLLDPDREPTEAANIGSAKKIFADGDVVISRLRAYLREIALVRTNGGFPSVGSSEFIVLRPKKGKDSISPEALMVFLRTAPVQTILKWCQDGSQHPRFSERDLLSIPVPDVVVDQSDRITAIVNDGLSARYEARRLIETAKRAVEIATEQGEPAAMTFLDRIEVAG